MESSSLLLLTGATGHVGYAVLVEALKAGHSVRVSIRRSDQKEMLLSSESIRKLEVPPGALTFTIVPDITEEGAFDEALVGVTHVIHVASPLPRVQVADLEREIVEPAVKSTENLLTAACKHLTIERVVITSSVAAIAQIFNPGRHLAALTADSRQPNYQADFVKDADTAYAAAKTAALNAIDEFVRIKKPSFAVTSIIPAYVFGPKGLARTVRDVLNGSNLIGLGSAMVDFAWDDHIVSASSCHIDDLAAAHIRALAPEFTGNQSFVLASQFEPSGIIDILEKRFPEAVEKGVFARKSLYQWHHIPIDTTRTESELLGRKLKGFDEQIVDTAAQALSLLAT